MRELATIRDRLRDPAACPAQTHIEYPTLRRFCGPPQIGRSEHEGRCILGRREDRVDSRSTIDGSLVEGVCNSSRIRTPRRVGTRQRCAACAMSGYPLLTSSRVEVARCAFQFLEVRGRRRASLSVPIFRWRAPTRHSGLGNGQQQEAAVSYRRTVLQAWHEIDNALTAYANEQRRNQELAEAVRSSRDAFDLANTRYQHGLTDFLVSLDAQRALLRAERDHADSSLRCTGRLVEDGAAASVASRPACRP